MKNQEVIDMIDDKDIKKALEFFNNSNIHEILKQGLFERIANDPEDLVNDVRDGQALIIELDTVLEFLTAEGVLKEDENAYDKEVDKRLDRYIASYFPKKLKGFPYGLMTEDYVNLYCPEK